MGMDEQHRITFITVPIGVVTFTRRSVPPDAFPNWQASKKQISSMPLHVDSKRTIEDADGLIQVDFANKFLGGGVLNTGCVQEEIRFVICPELMLSMLFTEMLDDNEALVIIGCERFSAYAGYGGSFRWSGDARDAAPRDSSARRRCAVLALDALPARGARHEHCARTVTRDLNKAWVGFSFETEEQAGRVHPGVGSGNWGCGAFGGTPQLKSLLQLLACAEARRPLAYFTFNDVQLRDDIVNVYNLLARHNVTVGELYTYIMNFTTTDVRTNQLYPYLYQVLQDCKPERPRSAQLPAQMDVGETESSELQLSGSVLKEFLNESPDLFSQDESDQSISEIKVDIPEPEAMDAADADPVSVERQTSDLTKDHTNRFMDEMQRFDEESGKLNLSTTNVTAVRAGEVQVDAEDAIRLDMSPDKKKKMGKKITDYFTKKPI